LTLVSWQRRKQSSITRFRYGTLRTWAEELGLRDAARLLKETLKEEEMTDKALTVLAKDAVNLEAEEELQAA
jgi:ferritin-like metal-binding protein YciE